MTTSRSANGFNRATACLPVNGNSWINKTDFDPSCATFTEKPITAAVSFIFWEFLLQMLAINVIMPELSLSSVVGSIPLCLTA
jgi:hypothetical protein